MSWVLCFFFVLLLAFQFLEETVCNKTFKLNVVYNTGEVKC